jgi:hypothetical protein
MSSGVFVGERVLRDLLRLARELALQLDADTCEDGEYVEVQLLRAVEAVEAELAKDERPAWRDVRSTLPAPVKVEP